MLTPVIVDAQHVKLLGSALTECNIESIASYNFSIMFTRIRSRREHTSDIQWAYQACSVTDVCKLQRSTLYLNQSSHYSTMINQAILKCSSTMQFHNANCHAMMLGP